MRRSPEPYRPGTTTVSLGTAGIISDPARFAARREMTRELDVFPHAIPEQWYAMGMAPSAGMSLGWLKARLADEALETGDARGVTMEDWLPSVQPPLSDFSPAMTICSSSPSCRAGAIPSRYSAARGVFWGLSGSHSNRHLVQAVMEGVGYCVGQCVDRMQLATPVHEIVCCGKGSSNPTWMHILANILKIPVWTNQQSEVGALGAASSLAGVGVGIFDLVPQACSQMTRRGGAVCAE